MNLYFVGIDPGASGGLAVVYEERGWVRATDMPSTQRDIWDWLIDNINPSRTFAVIEKVNGFIQGNPAPGSAMFNFGASYGALKMALTAAGISFEEVTPQRWQKGLQISSRNRNESKTAWKNRLKSRAQQLFPSERITLATADALLLAEYCRRYYGSNNGSINKKDSLPATP